MRYPPFNVLDAFKNAAEQMRAPDADRAAIVNNLFDGDLAPWADLAFIALRFDAPAVLAWANEQLVNSEF